jgi:hypothetical protein
MNYKSLWIPFFFALAFALYGTALFPALKVWPFSPFLAYLFYKVPFSKALWISFLIGFILDLLSSQFRFGLLSLTHVLVTLFFYRQKKHFFEDKPFGICLYSALLSMGSSAFLLLFAGWDHQISVSLPLIASDLILMPFVDGFYAFFWFIFPFSAFSFCRQRILHWLRAKEGES